MNEVTQPVRGRGTVLSALALVAALTAFLVFAPLASAASDPLASGTTKITLNKGLFKKLKKSKVKVLKVSPASVSGRVVTLPAKEGELDPTTGQGTVTHEGGLKFKKGKKKAPVTELVLTTSDASLKAKVAGKKMKFASVVGYTFTRAGFGVNVSITKLKLTKKAAKQLNKKLGFSGKKRNRQGRLVAIKPLFKAGQVLGGAAAETQPKTLTVLPGGKATLKTDLNTVKKFQEVLVNFEPINGAEEELALPPSFFFPIVGGTIAPDLSAGKVATSGGVRLVQQEFKPGPGVTFQLSMTLNAIEIDFSAKVASVEVSIDSTNQAVAPTPGNVGRSSIAKIDLTGATVTADPLARTVSVQNASSSLQAVTAETLNEVFGKPVGKAPFVEGDPLGTFSFTVQTQ